MDILGIFLGWNWKVQRTRRRWDRLREHALEEKGRVRSEALRELDIVEDKLKMIEEQSLTRRDRIRIMREVRMEMKNIADLLEQGEAWLASYVKKGSRAQQASGSKQG
jgi:hypothetical protein